MVSPRHSRQKPRQDYRNGYYERDFVTRFGTLRLHRIIYSIFQRFNPEWKTAPSGYLHKQLDVTYNSLRFECDASRV